ncbi:hypothetical protein V757_11145 [Pelistega indica]|uniref:Uncharacterized protein n=1 Tax=Pelistega indica TaxID=1414851 RepID=V8FVV1_9BURK|nr:hypothetical protein [Pelistega indica]ETD67537.1 hypothetical protein V757_11145 [Pelistega indica]
MSAKKPLKYESGKHVPFASDDTLDVSSIPLSRTAGNRIEVRGDGIGVWDTAPPNLATQYVDAVNGNDTNAGTRDAPLKTFAKALDRVSRESAGYGTFAIFLKSGQTHNVTQLLSETANAYIVVTTYDDPIFDIATKVVCPGAYAWTAVELQRATLQFNVIPEPGYETQYTTIPYIVANRILFVGVNIRRGDGRVTFPGARHFIIETDGLVQVQGCNIYIGKNGQFARPGSIWLQSCWVTFHAEASVFLSPINNPVVTTDSLRNEDPTAVERCPGLSYRHVGDNVRKALTPEKIGFVVNKESKTIFNGGTNWDIFA